MRSSGGRTGSMTAGGGGEQQQQASSGRPSPPCRPQGAPGSGPPSPAAAMYCWRCSPSRSSSFSPLGTSARKGGHHSPWRTAASSLPHSLTSSLLPQYLSTHDHGDSTGGAASRCCCVKDRRRG
uniref:Uncharacterized protein n=1 Tax=Triticum urartu TaxID=4572 RepID=A0A8R7NYX0_TRIUA